MCSVGEADDWEGGEWQDSGAGSGRAGHLLPQDSVYKGRERYLKFVWSRGCQVAVCARV